jgi:hypothetical protein
VPRPDLPPPNPPRPPIGPPITPPNNPPGGPPTGGERYGGYGTGYNQDALQNASGQAFQGPQGGIGGNLNLSPGVQAASAQVTGQGLESNPVIQALQSNFNRQISPQIQRQMELMGLGASSATANALANAWGGMAAPVMESQLGREERSIDRRMGGVESELGRQERSAVRQSEALQNLIPTFMGMSGQSRGNLQGAINQAFQGDQYLRGLGQAQNEAEYNEILRQQALREQALFGPFGQTMPAAFGSRQIQSGGGGMFK